MDKDPRSETAANGHWDPELAGCEHTGIENNLQHRKHNSKKAVRKRGKVFQNGRVRYSLRSSLDGVRVLRSMTKCKLKTSSEPSNSTVRSVTKKRKKKREGKSAPINEFSQRRNHISYLLRKINFEQSLIDAYVNEGWKGLSLEKIRPEEELQRAKSEILRCKLRIRDAFQQLDSLLSIGKLEENLFDDNGEIDSEDILCAKCGSKDISADNDIILCDGICDRAFHQKCLSPPLATNEIPPEDQGWLCPVCDCKVDCLDLLNEFQGTDFSIQDTWEKIFPEAAAVANGNNQFDDSIYLSEDLEDYDYQPDHIEGSAEDQEERSSFDESDSTSLSEDLGQPLQNKIDDLALPSDDPEDDDYDPDQPQSDKDEELDLNESDFTSDSDDSCADLHSPLNAENLLVEVDAGQGTNYPTSKKRQRESSDSKKLPDISKWLENGRCNRRASNVSNVYGNTGKASGKETIHSGTSTPDQDNSVTSVRNKKSTKGNIVNTPGQRKTLTGSNRKNTGSNTLATLDQPNSLIRSSIKNAKSSKAIADTPATLEQPNSLIRSSRKNAKLRKANANSPATIDQSNSLIRSSRKNAKLRKANANSPATIDQSNSLIRFSRKNAK